MVAPLNRQLPASAQRLAAPMKRESTRAAAQRLAPLKKRESTSTADAPAKPSNQGRLQSAPLNQRILAATERLAAPKKRQSTVPDASAEKNQGKPLRSQAPAQRQSTANGKPSGAINPRLLAAAERLAVPKKRETTSSAVNQGPSRVSSLQRQPSKTRHQGAAERQRVPK